MKRWIIVLVLVIVAAGGVAGYLVISGDDDDDNKKKESAEESSGSSQDSNELANILELAQTSSYKVTYESTSGTTTTELVYAQDPPKSMLQTDGTTYIQSDEETTILCSETDGTTTCTESAATGSILDSFGTGLFGTFFSAFAALPSVDDVDADEIAGRNALCSTLDASTLGPLAGEVSGEEQLKVCVDKKTGVLLLGETKNADGDIQTSVRATKFGEPSDDDFEPPVEPTSADEQLQDLQNLPDYSN